MQFEYKTKGTCSQMIYFEIDDNKVHNVSYLGGCNGNLQGISKLVEGMDIDAVISRVAGIHCGSPVTIEFKGEIVDSFGNAVRVEAPEEYNLLIGRWVAPYDSPYAEKTDMLHGFELLPDGSVIEIGEHSIIYNYWRYADGKLSLAEYEECLDEEIFDLVNHWQVEHLDRSTLTVSGYGWRWMFARSER